ncbi:MAG: serine hydrolase [Thermoanaerobaculia bacterium]|nr:serine hydrolase [Thermoanaerobaculia bacterium]
MRDRMTTAARRIRPRTFATVLILFSFKEISLFGSSPAPPAPPKTAVVATAVQDLFTRPDETSSVDDQVVLGERVEILEDVAGFAKVRTAAGEVAWIPERALRRGDAAPATRGTKIARVMSNLAHVYASPSFTKQKPLLTAPVGGTLAVEDFLEGEDGGGSGKRTPSDAYSWVRVRLPDGRMGFVARPDVALFTFKENLPLPLSLPLPLRSPSEWIAFGKRFLGAPYTWGGTTPLGFDCSGLIARIFSEHGVTLKRNSYQQAFQDPQLVPVSFEALLPGDLLFFGTEDKIDHEAMWIGDGTVLQSTRHNVPGVQITPFDSPFLKPLFRYARRLKKKEEKISSNGKEGAGTRLDAAKTAALRTTLAEIAAGSGATFGIWFKDLSSGLSLSQNSSLSMHAASTMKTPVLLEVLRRVDAGTLKLSDELPVKNEFKSLVDGSPFSIGLEEDDGPTVKKLGGTATLEFLATEMIVRSSNLATNLVLSHVGPANVQSFTDSLGAPTVKVRRCVEDLKAFEQGLNNETDAAGMATVMEAAVRSPRLSAAAKAKAWEILIGQTFNEEIPAGLHAQSGALVGHKTGSMSTSQHDAAVVRLPDGREYVLVLLANDFGANDAGRMRVIAAAKKMSRAVWEAMIAP